MRGGIVYPKVKGVVKGYETAQGLQGKKDVIIHDILKNEFIVIGFARKDGVGGGE